MTKKFQTNRLLGLALATLLVAGGSLLAACEGAAKSGFSEEVEAAMSDPGLYVVFETTMGDVVAELYPDQAPVTVGNFVGLAEGTKEFEDPETGEMVKRPFYDGLTFHRVIPDFMVQTGCPEGTGMGGPGYTIDAEFNDASFEKGVLGMARSSDPNSAGSQFFICVDDADWLDGQYTAFGQVTSGQDVADQISEVDTDSNDRPKEDIVMESVTVGG